MREADFSEALRLAGKPSRIVLAVSFDEMNSRSNIISLGWKMWTSFEPPMVSVSIGNTRYSRELIAREKEFVLAFPGGDLAEEVLFCGTSSGRDTDKFKGSGLTPLGARHIKPNLIKECPVNFECRVSGMLRTGDHTIFAGEVLCSYISRKKKLLLEAGTEQGYELLLERKGYRFGVIRG